MLSVFVINRTHTHSVHYIPFHLAKFEQIVINICFCLQSVSDLKYSIFNWDVKILAGHLLFGSSSTHRNRCQSWWCWCRVFSYLCVLHSFSHPRNCYLNSWFMSNLIIIIMDRNFIIICIFLVSITTIISQCIIMTHILLSAYLIDKIQKYVINWRLVSDNLTGMKRIRST